MKFSPALLLTVASADDKKVPPRHPLQRLDRLTEFSEELLTNWYSWLPSKDNWVGKFKNNAVGSCFRKNTFPKSAQVKTQGGV